MKYDGKFASRWRAKSPDALCAVLPYFIGHAGSPMLFFAIFILLTAVVVMLGVQKGVEKVSKLMMPVLLILIVGISIYTLTLPGGN